MNMLIKFANSTERIPLEYRKLGLKKITDDVLELVSLGTNVINEHVKNLVSLVLGPDKKVVKIEAADKCHTMDLEISKDTHSYYANGTPTHNTVNLPNDYPYGDFKKLYLDAYNTGYIKGITTYRAGTMTSVLSAKEERTATPDDEEIIIDDVKLPESAPADMKTIRAEGKKWYLTVVWNDTQKSRPFALFVHTNRYEKSVVTHDAVEKLADLARRKGIVHVDAVLEKISGDDNASKIARMISLNLRHGVLIKNIVSTLDSVEGQYVSSFIFQVKKFLSSFIKDGEVVEGAKCPDCGGNIVFQEGCQVCPSCGHTKCG